MRNVSEKKVILEFTTHILSAIMFFEYIAFYERWENSTTGQATDGSMVYAHCMLDT